MTEVCNTVEVQKLGVHYIVSFKRIKGPLKVLWPELMHALSMVADIIGNTDADNSMREDIEKLVSPILDGKADIVIGERPIDETEYFSPLKKKLQHFGSYIVRKASKTDIPDAPSGFRAFTREAAMHINVMNNYTYTLETIVQAGRSSWAITSVPVRTNGELRKSRLFHSMGAYVKRSMITIIRAYMMYRPLTFFSVLGLIPFTGGFLIGLRFLIYWLKGSGSGHIQSLIFASTLMLLGFMTFIVGLQADVIANNRKILEDIQYRIRKSEYDGVQIFDEKDNL